MGDIVEAAGVGDLAWVQALLPGEADEGRRVQALTTAITNGRLEVSRFLLEVGVPLEHPSCKEWRYPLHAAAHQGDLEAVGLLLDAGAQHDVIDRIGIAPLIRARSVSVSRLLLGAGADVNAGMTAAPLHVAAGSDLEDVLRALLGQPGVDVNITDNRGKSPLHRAAASGPPACVAALLAAGADPCAVDDAGCTPMTYMNSIIYWGHSQQFRVATLLVAAGDRSWDHVPTPCPGLEAVLVAVWRTTPKTTVSQELAQLFRRLEPGAQAKVRATLRALHHGARPFGGLPEPLLMDLMALVLE